MSDWAERAVSFANTAELYESARPGYPPDLIESLFAEIGIDEPRILDIGAGTGKLTRQLLAFGSVIAVEPLAEMRAQLRRVLPEVDCRRGNAEAIPLPDASVDVVMVGQAYHWFDQERANPEVARVLVNGGHLVAIWNHEKPVPWVRTSEEIMGRGHHPPLPSAAGLDAPADPPEDYRSGRAAGFQAAPWFTAAQTRRATMTVLTTKAAFLARCESYSALSVLSPGERSPILAELAELVESFPDPFDVEYDTEAIWCRKLPPAGS